MSKKYIAGSAHAELIKYIEDKGYEVVPVQPSHEVSRPVADHADLFHCRMGTADDAPVVSALGGELSPGYPGEARFCAACTGHYFIHNMEYTDPRLLEATEGMALINVRQGYTRCSTVVVDERSIITYDKGIALPCEKAGLDVLLIRPGQVVLPGYESGFIGGTCGRVGDEILFNGDLSSHPDFASIRGFIRSKGLEPVWFADWPLTDIGGIV